MKSLTKKLVSIITAAAFTASLPFALPAPAVDAQIIHWQHDEFDIWDNPNELPSSGSYLLESDVTLYHPIIVSENLNLCLNGHDIVFKIAPDKDYPDEKTYGFFITAEADFNIYAEESGGKIITQLCREGDNQEEIPSDTTVTAEENKNPADTAAEESTENPENPDSTTVESGNQSGSDTLTPDEPTETTPEETAEAPEETEPAQTASTEENQPEETTEETTKAPDTGVGSESEAPAETAESENEQENEPVQTDTGSSEQDNKPEQDTDENQNAALDGGTNGRESNRSMSEDNLQEPPVNALNEENLALHIHSFKALFKAEPESIILIEDNTDNASENGVTDGENRPESLPNNGDYTIISDPVLISHESSGSLNLYGATLESEGTVCIVSGNNGSVNIYGGEIKACENSPIVVCAKGGLKINDGIISGGIEFDGVQLVISGGKISGGVNVIGGNALISGGLITGENAVLALSKKNVEIALCDNAVLTGEQSALEILNENARVYLYGEPVLEGNVYIIPSENADNAVLSARCKDFNDDNKKIYTGAALNITLPKSNSGEVFNREIDGKYIVTGVSDENKDKFAVSEEYYSLNQESGALRLQSRLVKITDICLENTAVELHKEITLVPVISPDNYFERIIWSSSDPEIASVDETGRVTANRLGTVTITAAAHTDESIFASCEIEVTSSKIYGISYDTKGVNAHIGEKYKYYVYGEVTELPVPQAVGYSFVGWHRSSDLNDEIVTSIGAEESGDVTLYAQWSVDDYTLEFVLNGGAFEQENIPDRYTYGNEDVLPVPAKEGFKFMGWYENEDFSDSAAYKVPADAAGNKTYYAKWVENDAKEYSVIFRVDGEISVAVVYEGETPVYPKGVPARASDDKYDYEFAGWNPEITPAYGFDVYEAEFNAIPKSFGITFNPDGGVMENQPDTYSYGDTLALPIPEKEGYSFLGWYLDEEFSGDAVTEITADDVGDKVYFAKWGSIEENPDEDQDGEKSEEPEEVEISDEIIDIVWPANAKVILNPYKMKLAKSAASGSEIITDDVNGITDTVVSPELKFINKGSSEVKVVVTGSVNATTTAVDSDGAEFTYESRNIDFATAPIERPDRFGNGGDPNNTILLYLEQAYDVDSTGTGRYSQIFDSDNPRQMLLGRETVTREFFTIPASENEEGTKANVKICGDMSVNPVLSWDKLAKTDSVDINLVFTAVPASSENKENPEEKDSGEDTEKDRETADDKKEPDSSDENQGENDNENTDDRPEQSGSDTDLNEPEQSRADTDVKEPEQSSSETDLTKPEQNGDVENPKQGEDNQDEGQVTGDIAFKEPESDTLEKADGTAD